ncbi:hypothetical protein CcaverHIS002_0703210 [Cutaneotrichosporon cavernicola]|uniref:Transmembrane protein n=1 Tax=Cutaneotrichosporon cavernicola TaxID=279322 RepID=A0AA48LA25_9TREE|nr:uncharacterized protein CcaverHIS019_0703290 [Cutaneotrichosporon cavernicola]BEI86975.1 hypothetical protein CcaverHIS002_0703210 [Cutaneotrichosporon cavernicola]BEI94748.1 hypothetical protein CcaverHIS019_0703290 [Cutaneotrichosporon cavernicola]BEJ02523.1 hypothetical protein CcaverHIS631_0703180 [Cutaneotrichosporon cavernicola]BEJ10281.1 hypothetical protein CcaverHIS641_0703160 [Cutaneotrichosporon cavernicola]
MSDNKNNKGTYAAVARGTADNQPEGTLVNLETQPPPYTPQDGPSAPGPSGPSTQPPNTNPMHHTAMHHHIQRTHRTPRQTEEGVLIVVAHSPEYYLALSRARRRFWGTMLWALFIYFIAVMLVGGGIEDAYRNNHGKHRKHDPVVWASE